MAYLGPSSAPSMELVPDRNSFPIGTRSRSELVPDWNSFPIGTRSRLELVPDRNSFPIGTRSRNSFSPAPSPTVQAPSLAGHGQTALGPRPIPRRSHLELNPRSRLISPGWRGKTLMSSSADSPAFPPVRADAAGAAGARYIRPARVRSYPLPQGQHRAHATTLIFLISFKNFHQKFKHVRKQGSRAFQRRAGTLLYSVKLPSQEVRKTFSFMQFPDRGCYDRTRRRLRGG